MMHARLVTWSLRRRRLRNVLGALIMALTAAAVMLFVSVLVALITFTRPAPGGGMSRILVWPRLSAGGTDLPMALRAKFEAINGVKVVQCQKFIFGKRGDLAYVVSGEEESGVELNLDFAPVPRDVIEAWKKEKPTGAIFTDQLAKELNLKVGQTTELPTTFGPMTLKVVGLSSGGLLARRVIAHFEYAHQFTGNKGTCIYRVFTAPKDYEPVAKEIANLTKNSPTPVQAFSDAELTASWVRSAAMVPVLIGFLGLFLILTTALTLANSSSISVRERRIEIATMRTLGFSRGTILRMLLTEAVLVGLVGGVIAILVMKYVVGPVQLTPGNTGAIFKAITVSPLGMAAGLLISILVPLLGALPSAIASLRMPLVQALRDAA
jgi:putative ABC transport system permease protein